MVTIKSRLLVFTAGACLLCFQGAATAQKMMTGSAWRSVTQFGAIPKHTRIRVRTTEPIDITQTCPCRRFEGVVAKDVIGSSGNVLVSKGSNVELSVNSRSGDQLALDLNSIETNGEQFVADVGDEPVAGASAIGAGSANGSQVVTSGERIVVPEGSIVTFRLTQSFQPAR
jgi:hypothetical protein